MEDMIIISSSFLSELIIARIIFFFQEEYGEPEGLDGIEGYAKWETETSEITTIVLTDTIAALIYSRVDSEQ